MNHVSRMRRLHAFTMLMATAMAACSSSSKEDAAKTTESNTVEIYSWWTAGGEAQALSELIDQYKSAYPGHDVLNSTAMSADKVADAFATMNDRLAKDDPPDSWQAILGKNLLSYTQFVPTDAPKGTKPVNKTEDLTDLYDSEGWADKIPPGVLAAMKDGAGTYAVPISVGRINELFYNKAIFDKYKLSPPQSIDDLMAIGKALDGELDADGDPIIPLVISSGYDTEPTWPVRFVFDAIMMAEPDGIKFREDYYAGKADPSDPAYLQAATDFDKLLTSYTNAGNETLAATDSPTHALKVKWEDAADLVHSGHAAMFLHGNWVKAYLESKGDVADTDFGVVQFPPNAFVYAGDSFVLAKDAPHHDAAVDFLKLIGSADAQTAFNKIKGALPARTDADTSDFDTIGQQEAADFRDPKVTLVPTSWDYPPADYWTCWEDALLGEIKDHDPAAFAAYCVDKYPLLQK
ncbi:MAG TPA: ABC transporter substrate-binding protein [Polyangiaceae bacterium]|nr:ABC transporter substrate-binding protein [Polyangiaceae bacterium]